MSAACVQPTSHDTTDQSPLFHVVHVNVAMHKCGLHYSDSKTLTYGKYSLPVSTSCLLVLPHNCSCIPCVHSPSRGLRQALLPQTSRKRGVCSLQAGQLCLQFSHFCVPLLQSTLQSDKLLSTKLVSIPFQLALDASHAMGCALLATGSLVGQRHFVAQPTLTYLLQ